MSLSVMIVARGWGSIKYMTIIRKDWLEKQKNPPKEDADMQPDFYISAIIKVGEKVLDLMEALPENEPIDANALILEADKFYDEGITGNMAAYIALIGTKCHSRGEEFRKSWNVYNKKPESKGVVNPAIITIK